MTAWPQKCFWTPSHFPHPQGPWLGQGFTFICSHLVSIHSTPLPFTSRITVLKSTHPSPMSIDFLELPSASRTSPPAWLISPLTLWLLPEPVASLASTSLFLTSHSTAPSLYTTLCLIEPMLLGSKALAPTVTSPDKFLLILLDLLDVTPSLQTTPTL